MFCQRQVVAGTGSLMAILIALAGCEAGDGAVTVRQAPSTPSPALVVSTPVATIADPFSGLSTRFSNAVASPTVDCSASQAVTTPPPGSTAPAVPLTDVLCVVAAAPAIKSLPNDLVPPLERAEDDYGLGTQQAQECVAHDNDIDLPDCIFGDPGGTRTAVLLGDSHASMWLPSFDAAGKHQHWRVILLAKSACAPVYADIYDDSTKTAFDACSRFHDYSIARINQTQPDILVLSTAEAKDTRGEYFSGSAWSTALQKMLMQITIPNERKVVLGSTPYPVLSNRQISGPDCLAAHENNVQACSVPYQTAVSGDIPQAELSAAGQLGARFIDPSSWFCSRVCTAVIGKMNVYVHGGHISGTYAAYLSGAVGSVLQPIVNNR